VLTGGDPEWGDLVDGGEVVVTEREPYQVLDIPSPCDSVGPCRSSGSLTEQRHTPTADPVVVSFTLGSILPFAHGWGGSRRSRRRSWGRLL